jgi:hypothetical protein
MNFEQDKVAIDKIETNVRMLVEKGNFSVETVIVDGYDFASASVADIREFRRFARDNGFEIWFSVTQKEEPQAGKPEVPMVLKPFLDDIAILICLQPKGDFMHLALVKDHDAVVAPDLHLKLDPKILLIAEENQADRVA